MALPSTVVCHATTAIRGIVFDRAAMATAKNGAMATTVVLEEEGNGKGRKSYVNGYKEGDGEQRQ
jgi:hypothetical protein